MLVVTNNVTWVYRVLQRVSLIAGMEYGMEIKIRKWHFVG